MCRAAVLAILFAWGALAQDPLNDLLAEPSVRAWTEANTNDKLELASYGSDASVHYWVDFQHSARWCAVSLGSSPKVAERFAIFYTPSVLAGAVPPLPNPIQIDLKAACTLQAVWYEYPLQTTIEAVVRDLSAKWGQPNGSPFQPAIQSSGYWKKCATWHREGISVWAAEDAPRGPVRQPHVIVYARRDMPEDPWQAPPLQLVPAAELAFQQAAVTTPLASQILSRSHCAASPLPHEDASLTLDRLAKWLALARDLPRERKAAVLLLADFYVSCAEATYATQARLHQLGAKFQPTCPQDGPGFSHNFREQAEAAGSLSPSGELAQMVSLSDFCFLKGADHSGWTEALIAKANSILAAFPDGQWTPFAHYASAIAHSARLSFAYPGGDPVSGTVTVLSPLDMQKERQAAILQFKDFLQRKSDAPQAVFAWQEAWRLLAGLPPTRVHFDCGCE